MKLKNLLAFLLSFVTLFTMTAPSVIVFAEETGSGAMYYVGGEREYKTINEALNEVKQNPPKSEAERAVINIDPGTYEEQIIFDNLKYITIRQTPDTSGGVKLSWYYCTGYAYSNCDLDGKYNPDIDWYDDRTWNGYKDGDEKFTKYLVGQPLSGVSEISYYDKNGVAHKNEKVKKAHLGSGFPLDGMAPLCVKSNCTDITIEDLHIVNSVPVMVTQGEKDAHITPEGTVGANGLKPRRENLSVCDEDVEEVKVNGSGSNGILTNNDVEKQRNEPFSPGESAYIARSGIGNERGHALSLNGDRIIVKNVYARGNQDSVYISTGRIYFENCNLIGGTDYIYGSATAVFNNCKLGLAGMSDKSYGSPMATPSTPTSTKYGYLFYNCMIYNTRTNNGANDFGGSWGSDGQSTFYNTTLDNGSELYGKSKEVIADVGWTRFGVENGTQRMYEYGTKNADGTPVDTSKRVKNKSVEEGGPGMGTVIDEWQVLEFNPRNYFSSNNGKGRNDDWDPMSFGKTYLEDVDSEIERVNISVPAGNETTVILPEPTNSNIEFKWESMSDNAVVSDDGKSIEVIRPALGEEPIQTSVILYARDKQTKFGDKKIVDITIASTTDSTNVFNMPVLINASTNADGNCDYTITITKNGALIKQDKVTVLDGEMNATATIDNLPANADGIEYDIKIVSSSDEFTVTAPEEGKTKVIGKTGVDVPLNITAQKIVDKTVDIDGVFAAGTTDVKNFDLISLAKDKGADGIDSSDIITIDYDVNTTGALTKTSYIDLTSKAASSSCSVSADKSRFALWRFYGNWNQLDMVDSSAGFSGTKNIEGTQWLNIVGKFTDASKTSHVTTTINYKTASIIASGSGSNNLSSFVFEHFPENYVKGKLNFTVYPGGSDLFTISNIKVTYKDVVTGDNSGDNNGDNDDNNNTEKNPSIINAEISDGNTIVNLKNISDGVVVAVKYDEGKMKSMKTTLVSGDSVTIDEIEADSVFVWDSIEGMKPLCKAYVINSGTEGEEFDIDFTKMEEVPVYSAEKGQGFVSASNSIMPDGYARKVADVSKINISKDGKGASVTESDGSYLKLATDDNNFGGLIYRVDTGAPGAYHIEVEVGDANVTVAPTGMTANNLTGTGAWDTAGLVNRLTSAKWEDLKWSYDFATGEKFIEIEIEPKELPTVSKPQTAAVKSIKVVPISVNPKGSKPTIHILGDSTQKTYTFHSTISSWGQTLIDYFDTDKVNVVNYSLGGRSMKTNYMEGRTDDVLMRGKEGDFVFIHSAHNDETNNAQKRTIRGTNLTTSAKPSDAENEQYREASNALYNRWLDMYVEAIKARGMTPVLVTAMPRVNGSTGKYSEGGVKPNGFYPDSPGNMRKKAAADKDVALIELYDGAKDYIDSIDGEELRGIYNQLEAGEMPGGEGSSTANGNTGDGTHYKESAGRQWCRIMLESMYAQSNASEDIYTDKKFMTELVSYTKKDVQDSMKSGDWSKVFPEMTLDVSAVGIVPGAEKQSKDNYYFRNSIEKVLQLGIMSKDASNKFYPTNLMTVGEFARSAEKAFGLEANSLTSYNKTYAELKEAGATEIILASTDLESKSSNVSSSKTNNVDLAAEGEYTVKVNQVDGGTVTVYNETDFAHKTVDITDNITANEIIDDNDYFTLTAPSEVVKKTDSKGVFKNKDISAAAVELRNNGTKQVAYKAKESGILTMYLMFVGNKFITCENLTDNTMQQKYNNNTTEKNPNTANDYVEVTFDVEKGKEYSLYTNGGTGRLFGVQYTTEQQTSQEEITVKSGTVVKVAAERQNAKWRLESILKDGKPVEDGSDSFVKREYTFIVDGNTVVSAKFNPYSEPDVVKTTLIASDAVLTREAMAAVLYDAYSLKYGDKKLSYMTDHNGTVMSPDDPAYDPNIKQEGSYYWPITGWDVLKDIDGINKALYGKAKEVYNLGLMRSDLEYKRGSVVNGDVFEPAMAVTRARAAKALAFIYILTQPELGESQVLPNGNLAGNVTAIQAPNTEVPSIPYEIK